MTDIDLHLLLAFSLVAVLAYVVPGPDWFVVLGRASRSRREGLLGALGVQCGLVVHMVAAAAGVSALLLASAEAFTVVKLAGACYLVVLGLRSLRSAHGTWRRREQPDPAPAETANGRGGFGVWAQAFTANLLNPKAALFFVAVLPQFLSPSAPVAPQILLLGVLDIAIGCLWWALFVLTTARFSRFLARRRARIAVDTVSGLALTGLGGALALTSRSRA